MSFTVVFWVCIGSVLSVVATALCVAVRLMNDRGGHSAGGLLTLAERSAGPARHSHRKPRPPSRWVRARHALRRRWYGLRVRGGLLCTRVRLAVLAWRSPAADPCGLTAAGRAAAALLEWMISQALQADAGSLWEHETGWFTAVCGVA